MRDVASTERQADEMGVGTGERCERRTKRKKSRRGRLKRRAGCGGRPEEQVEEEWEGGGRLIYLALRKCLPSSPVASSRRSIVLDRGMKGGRGHKAGVRQTSSDAPPIRRAWGNGHQSLWSAVAVGGGGIIDDNKRPLSAIARTTAPVSRVTSGRGSRLWRRSSRRGTSATRMLIEGEMM